MFGEGDGRFLLVYGSETGQAKAVAEKIFVEASQHGLSADLHCFSETDKKFDISKEKCVVIIVSTTGDGDPPQTVHKFWRRIRKHTLPSDYLSRVNYALLALGDSNYNNFCNCGKTLDKRLEELSAKRFYPTGYADDAVSLEEDVEPWVEGLWTALTTHLNVTHKEFGVMTKEIKAVDTFHIERISDLKINDHESTEQNNIASTESTPISHGESYITDNNVSVGSNKLNKPINQDEVVATDKEQKESLCTPSLGNRPLKLPNVPPCNLEIIFIPEISPEVKVNAYNNDYCPSAASHVTDAAITSAKWLTSSPDVKKYLQLTINIMDTTISYEPGDSFGFMCCNPSKEVEGILSRLNLSTQADRCCHLKFKDIGKGRKKNNHLPEYSTLWHLFSCCCEIRAVPKKVFLRLLSEYTSNENERRRLNELSSKEGSTEYMTRIFEPQLSLLDILTTFPSCSPPVEAVLEHLPSLKPRFYSVTSSPLISPHSFNVLFNIVEIARNNTKGVCTGWLSKLVDNKYYSTGIISPDIQAQTQDPLPSIKIYKRINVHFHLPSDPSTPIIMVGPGTGIAPFIGFLQHRQQQQHMNEMSHFGESWLFYGCRYEEKDYLYKKELQKFQVDGILTRLLVAFSQQDPRSYVQDIIISYCKDIVKLIKAGAIVYVCGDAKNMSQDIFKAFALVWSMVEGCTMELATDHIKQLQEEKRYLQDVWA